MSSTNMKLYTENNFRCGLPTLDQHEVIDIFMAFESKIAIYDNQSNINTRIDLSKTNLTLIPGSIYPKPI